MTPRPRLAPSDDAARRRICQSLRESLIVEASAGTGKTTELVNRIVQVLSEGLTAIDRIVAVTFTHKAAGELKIRLRQRLDDERARARDGGELEKADRLESALEELEEATIGTIHGFCAQILRSRPVEARVDPAFEELTEAEAARIYDRAFQNWFQRQLEQESPGLRRGLARLAWRPDWETGPATEALRAAGKKLIEWRDFTALWQSEPFDRDAAVRDLLERARHLWGLARACTRTSDGLVSSLRPLRDALAWIERGRVADYDTLEAVLLKLSADLRSGFRKGSGFFSREVTREEVVRSYENFQTVLEQFRLEAGVLLACQLQQEMQSLVTEYTDLKARTGRLDFVDLLLRTRDLVRDDRTVREYLQDRFSHVFVDEFQDTDPLQAEILLLLVANDPFETNWLRVTPVPGKLFLVGDPKQSIYKFRRADVSLYARVADQLVARGVGRVYLTESYRSLREINQFVNAAFATEMTGNANAAQAGYSPLEETGREIPGQPAIVALPAPAPYGMRDITKSAIDACLPSTVAAFVFWLVNKSNWQVRENGDLVPVQARHVCILFRRFINFRTDLTRDYVRALEARGVPHLLVGSRSFHDREEVETVRTALTAIEWPEDELSVYATLRGSLFAINDGVLLRFRHEFARLHPFRKYPEALPADFRAVTQALAVLAALHRERNRRPVSDTVRALLDETRAHAGFAMRPGGQQVLANVYRICDLARQYEMTGGFSFRGFVDELNAQAEKTEAPEAPVLEEAADGVRLMTVHNAKGLEFPVVILADMTANLSAREPERFIDGERGLCATRLLRCAPRELIANEAAELRREQAEGVRVCYVAATRARDLLVVSAVGDEARSGWLEPLNKALYPPRDSWRAAEASPQWFTGDRTVLERPYPPERRGDSSVMPGWHRPSAGEHRVLWWDPAALDLEVRENFGLRQVNVLRAEGAAERSIAAHENWRAERAAVIERAVAPTLEVVRVTELQDEPPGGVVALERAVCDGVQSRGRRFGSLVHSVLRDARWSASKTELEQLAALHRVISAAGEQEQRDAVEAAARALAHPLVRRAARAERCHRELPVTFPLGAARVLEGVIDLAFVEDGTWHVVDYKTDDDVQMNRSYYERQLRWYMHALSSLTGMPAHGTLLQV